MSRMPRLLPLVGVAIVGVIAVNALSGAHALPQLVSATQAAAEEALKGKSAKHKDAPAEDAGPADAATPKAQSALPPGATAQTVAAPVCATSPTDLARAAGMSPAELQVLQSLQTRRGQIDDREKDLDTEIQLLAAAEAKVDGKIKSMNGLKADIQALLGQADQKSQAEVDRLTIVYSKMKPQDAAAVMAQLDDKVRLPIAAAMKPAVLSAILDKMGTLEAKDLTEKLAHRFAPVQALAQAAVAPTPTASAAATPAPATPPSKTASAKAAPPKGAPAAAAPTDDASQTADPAPAKDKPVRKAVAKPKPKPRAVAKVVPKKAPAKPRDADAALPDKPQPYAAQKDKAPAAPPAAAPTPAKSS